MNDLKPFVHGSEGTHISCQERLELEGGQARCCYCVPHDGCDFVADPAPHLPEDWETRFLHDWYSGVFDANDGEHIKAEKVSVYIARLLTQWEQAVVREIEKLKKSDPTYRNDTEDGIYNQALSDILALIQKKGTV